MFMFKKKKMKENTITKLHKKATNFHDAVEQLRKINPNELTFDTIKHVATTSKAPLNKLKNAFRTNLERNAISKIKEMKTQKDYTILDLVKTAEIYGCTLDGLQVTFHSVD